MNNNLLQPETFEDQFKIYEPKTYQELADTIFKAERLADILKEKKTTDKISSGQILKLLSQLEVKVPGEFNGQNITIHLLLGRDGYIWRGNGNNANIEYDEEDLRKLMILPPAPETIDSLGKAPTPEYSYPKLEQSSTELNASLFIARTPKDREEMLGAVQEAKILLERLKQLVEQGKLSQENAETMISKLIITAPESVNSNILTLQLSYEGEWSGITKKQIVEYKYSDLEKLGIFDKNFDESSLKGIDNEGALKQALETKGKNIEIIITKYFKNEGQSIKPEEVEIETFKKEFLNILKSIEELLDSKTWFIKNEFSNVATILAISILRPIAFMYLYSPKDIELIEAIKNIIKIYPRIKSPLSNSSKYNLPEFKFPKDKRVRDYIQDSLLV